MVAGGFVPKMRHILFLRTLLFVAIIAASGRLLSAEDLKLKVAVLDFKTVGDSAGLGEGVAEILRTTLVETGRYTIIERGMLAQVMEEQKLSLSGIVDPDKAADIGKILGAQLVAVGSVVKMGESYTLNIRFVDVETGEVVSGKKLTAQNREDIPGLCGQMVKMLSKREVVQEPEEEQPLPQQIPKPHKIQAPEIKSPPASGTAAGGWALGGFYPGASLKYAANSKSAWELRAQSGSGVFALGPRYYRYFTQASSPRLFFGIEGDYIPEFGAVFVH